MEGKPEIGGRGGERETGGWLYNGGMEDPSNIAYPPSFFQILSTPPPYHHFPVTSNPHPHCSFCCHVSILLYDNMDLYMLHLGSLVPEGPWWVFYATWHQVLWGLTQNINIYLHHLLCAHSSYLYYIKLLYE